ncbi:MAG: 2-isopropylmalate synthase, partial [Candidatus Eremiobacterota bacterium]
MPYDWNLPDTALLQLNRGVEFQDETLRDGLQRPSACDPPIQAKLEILHCMEALGIHGADVGLP